MMTLHTQVFESPAFYGMVAQSRATPRHWARWTRVLRFFLLACGAILMSGIFGFTAQATAPAPPETMKVKVYFSNNTMDPDVSCDKVFAVERTVPKTQAPARSALEELLKGPTAQERARGFVTSINPGVTIRKLIIEDGRATVDFDRQLEFQVGGSCRVTAIRAQITHTLLQFPAVNNVVISIDGRTRDILQP